jgi:hypothetical protein
MPNTPVSRFAGVTITTDNLERLGLPPAVAAVARTGASVHFAGHRIRLGAPIEALPRARVPATMQAAPLRDRVRALAAANRAAGTPPADPAEVSRALAEMKERLIDRPAREAAGDRLAALIRAAGEDPEAAETTDETPIEPVTETTPATTPATTAPTSTAADATEPTTPEATDEQATDAPTTPSPEQRMLAAIQADARKDHHK